MSSKRDLIVAAALKLFCKNGFQSTSTANISKEAGVATGTLFLYFKSKDELINSLYKRGKNSLAVHIQKDLSAEAPIEAKLQHFWQKTIEWALENNYSFRFISMFSNSPFISNLTKEEAASTFHFTQNLIDEAVKEGDLTPIDSNLFVSLFSAQLTTVIHYLEQNPSLENKQSIIDQTFNSFLERDEKSVGVTIVVATIMSLSHSPLLLL